MLFRSRRQVGREREVVRGLPPPGVAEVAHRQEDLVGVVQPLEHRGDVRVAMGDDQLVGVDEGEPREAGPGDLHRVRPRIELPRRTRPVDERDEPVGLVGPEDRAQVIPAVVVVDDRVLRAERELRAKLPASAERTLGLYFDVAEAILKREATR